MTEKPSCLFTESQNPHELTKVLKIIGMGYKSEYIPFIRIVGKYLEAYNFKQGGYVELVVSENKIVISKIIDGEKN
jgi:hypothetical protein